MTNEIKPFIEVKPGDPITAGRWNDTQRALREEHVKHAHTGVWKDGLFDGAPLTTAGLADGAVTAAKLDPAADLKARSLRLDGPGDALSVSSGATLGALRVSGPADLASLRVADIATLGSLKVTGTAEFGGPVTLGSLTVSGALTIRGNVELMGTLSQLDVAERSEVRLRCSDLRLGHSSRSGKLGRAFVDGADRLVINYGGDWKLVEIESPLHIQGRRAAVAEGREQPRIVWGMVDGNGAIVAGEGFTTERPPGKVWTWIRFTVPFRSRPAVFGQQLGSGKTTDNTLLDDVNEREFSVMTGNANGDREWRPFCFLAIGPI